ncbi:unnamed protein product [Prorocentrum cordatum]|uniref:Uncharacterized protein n=1 Tax=Prorocentrum cordatum TaxID=2364126 RepID=A0ABN9WK46_9DINO|nr:unnamed protein product [Polarella glacialis]
MARQDALYSFGASGVLMELEGDPEGLQQKVRLELAENTAMQLRVQSYETTVTAGVLSSSEIQTIEDERDSLLWETIPNLLLPGLKFVLCQYVLPKHHPQTSGLHAPG